MKLQSSQFTIYEVENLKQDFMDQLKQNDPIELDLSNITKIDISAIQMLISLKKSCEHSNSLFSIQEVSEEVGKAFQISGCDTVLGVQYG